jgi:chemotaxis protein methyltransferase CheR
MSAQLERALSGLNRRIWEAAPAGMRASRPMLAYGRWLHRRVARKANPEMYLGTLFLRNRPALELMRRLIERRAQGSTVSIAVLGCSIGVEVYSILWVLRRDRPDLKIVVEAVDISEEVLEVARRGVYGPETFAMVGSEVFERLSESELQEMFVWDGEQARVKPWLQEGITWEVADVSDQQTVRNLGEHDLVVASNFLCHLDDATAEGCMRNFAQLVRPGGYVFVAGVNLDVRTRVARELGWEPVAALRAEMHDGDPLVRADWPWSRWGLEPLDLRRRDWETRYASAFQVGRETSADTTQNVLDA